MKTKHKIVLCQEIYTTFEIEADSQEEANEKVMSGEFEDEAITDVSVKSSEILS